MTVPIAPTGKPKPRAVLVGPPGAGKSTIGKRLAYALNVPFTDTDDLLAEEAGMDCGDYFADKGEEAFREHEERVVAEALNRNGVIALGGGAILSEATRDLLARHLVIFVDVSVEEGARRTSETGNRPVLAGTDPVARYRELLDQRLPLYLGVADYRARTDERTPQQVVGAILSFLDTL